MSACDKCARGRLKPPLSVSVKTASRAAPKGAQPGPVRRYYIAAEPIAWRYAPLDRDPVNQATIPDEWRNDPEYKKYHYVQYTDATFTKKVPPPRWLGILGPVIHGVVGETLLVTFYNKTDHALSMHPHGLRYDKDSEGAYYFPDSGKGSWVIPDHKFTYVWKADAESGPLPGEPSSKVWLYHSHVMADADINLGLVGAIVITDKAHARPDGTPKDVDREFVTLFYIFDENPVIKSPLEADDESPEERQRREAFEKLSPLSQEAFLEHGLKHTINGYMFGNLQGLEMNEGDRVRWYLLALGSERDMHTAHWHAKTVVEDGRRRTDVVELAPASMKVADMVADNPGTWLFHCHVADHMMSGMFTHYVIHPRPRAKAMAARPRNHLKQHR